MLLRRARDRTDVSDRRDLGPLGFQAVDRVGGKRDLGLAGDRGEYALLEQALQGDVWLLVAVLNQWSSRARRRTPRRPRRGQRRG